MTNHRAPIELLEARRLFHSAVALTNDGRLVGFDLDEADEAEFDIAVTGLQNGETLVGIDYRPADGRLYGVGSTSRLYVIDDETAVATQIGSPFTVALSGDSFGIDFNPNVDRLRIVSNTDQNLRMNPNTGAIVDFDTVTTGTQPDGELNYNGNPSADPVIVAAGYTNSFSGAPSTVLYGIDSATNTLVRQGSAPGVTPVVSPNSGTLYTIGALGIDVNKTVSLDITTDETGGNVAYALIAGRNRPVLHTINLNTGTATAVTSDPLGRFVPASLAIKPETPQALVLTTNGQIFRVAVDRPTESLGRVSVSGLVAGDTLVGIDYRPANGVLYGLGANSNFYTIDTDTGVATQVGGTFAVPLSGNTFGFDFNPTVDRIRVVSNTGQSLRLNPDTGAVVDSDTVTTGTQIDGNVDFDNADANSANTPLPAAAAYTNSVAPTPTATDLFVMDAQQDVLIRVGSAAGASPVVSPNTGTSFTIGTLGFNAVRRASFDVFSDRTLNRGLAVLQADGQTRPGLYNVDLRTGEAIRIGSIGNGRTVIGFSVIPITA